MALPLTLAPPSRRVDIVALGENSLDFVAVAAGDPPIAGKQTLTDFRLQPGGQMATAALGCARLGLRTRYVGAFGDDEWSRRSRAPLDAAGVELVAHERPGTPGRIAVIVVDAAGERSVYERRDPALVLRADEVARSVVADARLLLVDVTHPDAALRAVGLAREAGVVTISDVDRVTPEALALLADIDVAIVPAPFVINWTGTLDLEAGLTRLSAHCRRAAVVIATLGAEGCIAWSAGVTTVAPGLVVDVVDTTGAGDAFRAGFAAALVHLGADAPLADLLRFANVTGALNCRAVGAQTALPALADVMAHVTSGRPDVSK